ARLQAGDPLWELERREQELLAEFEADWAPGLAGLVDWWVFRRGFVAEIATSASQFLAHGRTLFRRFPIQEVHLDRAADDLSGLSQVSFLGRARHLDLSENRIGDDGVSLLVKSPHLVSLRGLN